jgi:hypothetical protein
MRAATVFTSGLPGAPPVKTSSAFARSSPLRSIIASASASDATCTPQTKLLMNFTARRCRTGPSMVIFAHRGKNRTHFFQRGGIAADEKIQFAGRRVIFAAGHGRVEKFAFLFLRGGGEFVNPADRDRAAFDANRSRLLRRPARHFRRATNCARRCRRRPC